MINSGRVDASAITIMGDAMKQNILETLKICCQKTPWRRILNFIPVYKPGKPIEEVKRELGLEKVIKLASNENSQKPSPRV